MNGVVWLSKQFYQPELGHFCFKDEALHFTTTFGLEFCEHFFLRKVRHLRKLWTGFRALNKNLFYSNFIIYNSIEIAPNFIEL